MAHNLIVNYGLDKKMEVLVRRPSVLWQTPIQSQGRRRERSSRAFLYCTQRPKRSTPFDMTSFHTDEYIDFLQRVSPESVDELTGKGTRCELVLGDACMPPCHKLMQFELFLASQSSSEKTARHSTASLNSVPSLPADPRPPQSASTRATPTLPSTGQVACITQRRERRQDSAM